MNSAVADMIYLDPPFNSNRMFEAPIGSPAEGSGFKDIWQLDDIDLAWHEELRATGNDLLHDVILAASGTAGPKMMSYLIYMTVRLLEMKRVLKPNGSIFLHCDDRAGAYLRVLMDGIFGASWYKNEIIWKRTSGRSDARKFGRIHDVILYYAGKGATWNTQYMPHDPEYLEKNYSEEDGRGRWGTGDLTAPGHGSGSPAYYETWKGATPSPGRMWNAPAKGGMADWIREHVLPDWPDGYPTIKDKLDALDEAGLIYWPKRGSMPSLKRYLAASEGRAVGDIITDIKRLEDKSKEKTGFKTQKPTPLIERLIRATTEEGDLVIDPFCGCATTAIAAQKAGRRWAGIDMSPKAVDLVRYRLDDELGLPASLATTREDAPVRTDLGTPRAPRTQLDWLFGVQGGQCAGCANLTPKKIIEVDHIIATGGPERGGRGGTDHWSNLQLLCGHCNKRKSDGEMSVFVAKIVDERGGYDPALGVRRDLALAKERRAAEEGVR